VTPRIGRTGSLSHDRRVRRQPILRIERLTYAQGEKPLVFEYLHDRAETFKYKMKVLR
jgi:DNA-binding GntR family transcriptional regulator